MNHASVRSPPSWGMSHECYTCQIPTETDARRREQCSVKQHFRRLSLLPRSYRRRGGGGCPSRRFLSRSLSALRALRWITRFDRQSLRKVHFQPEANLRRNSTRLLQRRRRFTWQLRCPRGGPPRRDSQLLAATIPSLRLFALFIGITQKPRYFNNKPNYLFSLLKL